MTMGTGAVTVPAGALFVDCTAEGLQSPPPRPIFETRRITPQGVREGSPSFNAALIGHLEATRGEDLAGNTQLMPPNVYPSVALDWIRQRHTGMTAQMLWDQQPDLAEWIEGCRLNIAAGLIAHAGEPGVGDAIGRYLMNASAAIGNLAKLYAEASAV